MCSAAHVGKRAAIHRFVFFSIEHPAAQRWAFLCHMIILQGLGQNKAVVVPLQNPASGSKKRHTSSNIT